MEVLTTLVIVAVIGILVAGAIVRSQNRPEGDQPRFFAETLERYKRYRWPSGAEPEVDSVPLPPDEALEQLTVYLTQRIEAVPTGRIGNTATFERRRKASTGTVIVLVLFSLALLPMLFILAPIPIVLYLWWASKRESFTVTATAGEAGTQLVFGGDPGHQQTNSTYVKLFMRDANPSSSGAEA